MMVRHRQPGDGVTCYDWDDGSPLLDGRWTCPWCGGPIERIRHRATIIVRIEVEGSWYTWEQDEGRARRRILRELVTWNHAPSLTWASS